MHKVLKLKHSQFLGVQFNMESPQYTPSCGNNTLKEECRYKNNLLCNYYQFILGKYRILKHIEQHETFNDKVSSSRL